MILWFGPCPLNITLLLGRKSAIMIDVVNKERASFEIYRIAITIMSKAVMGLKVDGVSLPNILTTM